MALSTKPVKKRDRLLAMIRNEDAASSAHRINRTVRYGEREQAGEGLREQIGAGIMEDVQNHQINASEFYANYFATK